MPINQRPIKCNDCDTYLLLYVKGTKEAIFTLVRMFLCEV